jgi:hypothetical protein
MLVPVIGWFFAIPVMLDTVFRFVVVMTAVGVRFALLLTVVTTAPAP